MITLVAILCHQLAAVSIPVCEEKVIPTETMVAGKVDDPIPMPPLTMGACKVQAPSMITDWKSVTAEYHDWVLVAWECVPGTYAPSKRA